MMNAPKKGFCPLPILPALPDGAEKRMHIYLPPGYAANDSVRYPVLYLNHGGGDDDAAY